MQNDNYLTNKSVNNYYFANNKLRGWHLLEYQNEGRQKKKSQLSKMANRQTINQIIIANYMLNYSANKKCAKSIG